MPAWSVKPSASSAAEKFDVIWTDAPASWPSGSLTVKPTSIATGASPSTRAAEPADVATAGASLTGVTAIAFVASGESASPSLTTNVTVLDVAGSSFVVEYPTDRSAVW